MGLVVEGHSSVVEAVRVKGLRNVQRRRQVPQPHGNLHLREVLCSQVRVLH